MHQVNLKVEIKKQNFLEQSWGYMKRGEKKREKKMDKIRRGEEERGKKRGVFLCKMNLSFAVLRVCCYFFPLPTIKNK